MDTKKDLACCANQCEQPLDKNFWNTCWKDQETNWDIGQVSPAIAEYMLQYPNKDATILIPGCGNAYEAEFLLKEGYTNITLVDISPKAVENLSEKFASAPQVKVRCEDFFLHEGIYDILIEQTFFCAIPPHRRKEYAEKASLILREHGKVIGLLFDKKFEHQGPPFGGCPCEYKPIFGPYFHIQTMEECKNSIAPRAGAELFVEFVKM